MQKVVPNTWSQLDTKVENGRLVISIGVNLLAWAIQLNEQEWPEDLHISNPDKFARRMAQYLLFDEEDGSTELHRCFDKTALLMAESGEEEIDEGEVQNGIDILNDSRVE